MTIKEKNRDKYLRAKWGITLEMYNTQLMLQKHACAVCQRPKENFKSSLAVDHNHKTGQLRGLVCYGCNKFKIGRNNFETTQKLYQYMVYFEGTDRWPGRQPVLKKKKGKK